MAIDPDGMLQLSEIKRNASLWCDAYIGDGKDSPEAKAVLAKSPLGSRCVIDGHFAGHGVFYWTKIISAKQR